MNEDLLSDIKRLKGIIRAKKTRGALDRLHLDLLKRAEKFFKNGDELHTIELCAAVTALDKPSLISRESLAKIRERYSEKCADETLDELLEKHFGKYILSEPLNELSAALTGLRAALLGGTGDRSELLRNVRSAAAKLPAEYSELRQLISAACDRTEELLAVEEAEQACALIDAVHALPEIAGAPKASLRGYKRCFVKPYEKQFNDIFFESFDLNSIIK